MPPKRPHGCLAAVSLLVAAYAVLASGTPAQAELRHTATAIVSIAGEINPILQQSVERRVAEAQAAGAHTIIFEMDTPGGRVDCALAINRLIKGLTDVHTVAWVHNDAYSAGALISVACDEIWMSPSSSIGDCAPIMPTPEGGVEAPKGTLQAKAESPIISEFLDSAARNGYNPLLSRAMVTVETEVWWLENTTTHEREFVTGETKQTRIDDVAEADRQWQLVKSVELPMLGRPFVIHQPIDADDALLTMSQYEAVAYGFAKGIAANATELAAALDLAQTPPRLDMSGWETFAGWLNSPWVLGVLMVLVFVGGYMEFQHPGLILPGATAAIALIIVVAAPYAAGLATLWPAILIGLGLVLLGIEIFVIPGFGITGMLGILCTIAGLLATFIPAQPDLPPLGIPDLHSIWEGFQTGIKVLVASMVASIIGILGLIKLLPQTRFARGIVLDTPGGDQLSLADPHPDVAHVGDVGIVTGDLRPGGQARFGQEVVDVASQGQYVEAGRKVQVISRDGMRIVVRPLDAGDQTKA